MLLDIDPGKITEKVSSSFPWVRILLPLPHSAAWIYSFSPSFQGQ